MAGAIPRHSTTIITTTATNGSRSPHARERMALSSISASAAAACCARRTRGDRPSLCLGSCARSAPGMRRATARPGRRRRGVTGCRRVGSSSRHGAALACLAFLASAIFASTVSDAGGNTDPAIRCPAANGVDAIRPAPAGEIFVGPLKDPGDDQESVTCSYVTTTHADVLVDLVYALPADPIRKRTSTLAAAQRRRSRGAPQSGCIGSIASMGGRPQSSTTTSRRCPPPTSAASST